MKKTLLTTLLTAILASSSAFANMTVFSANQEPSNSKDYVGKIVAAIYTDKNAQPSLQIMTYRDKSSESNLPALHITFDGADLPFGMTLASAIGKKIAVYGQDETLNLNDRLTNVLLITDEYWTGKKH